MPRPRINLASRSTYQRWSRKYRRQPTRVIIGVFAACVLIYWFTWTTDVTTLSFDQHEAYMNDRKNVKGFVAKQSYDWRKAPFRHAIKSYTQLPSGTPRTLPPVQFKFTPETPSHRTVREQRRAAVRKEFQRSWKSYRKYAWASDELMPITGQRLNPFGGWGATLVDSLDTLWIMGFKKEFYEAVEAVSRIDFGKSGSMINISVFETTIRYLGGLLSAYDLSQEKVLLDKAIQIGEMLYRAFDTINHMPLDRLTVEAAKDENSTGFTADSNICFAGLASLTMEFTRLAQITQQPKYYDAVARVTTFLDTIQNTTRIPGLFPTWFNAHQETATDRSFTMGAMADSSYEYFPKMYALLGGLEPVYEKLYKTSAPLIDKHLFFRPMVPASEHGEDLLFSGDVLATSPTNTRLEPEMQHLTCFVGGMFGLAGRLFSLPQDVDTGAKLTEGCIYAYAKMPTGIMPESFTVTPCASRTSCPFNATKWELEVLRKTFGKGHDDFLAMAKDLKLPEGFSYLRDKRYLLRPEAIESVFVMYRITGYDEYLDHAWDMFGAIREASRTRFANGQVYDVTEADPLPLPEDKMESFWTAETLKYFYLIFSPPDMISLDDFVFNTEAHPFKRPHLANLQAGGGAL